MKKQLHSPRRQQGISLIETLIGLTIAGAAMIYMADFGAQVHSETKGKNMAESQEAFRQAASQYFITNATEMMDAMVNTGSAVNANKHCRIDVPVTGIGGETKVDPVTRLTCMFDVSLLAAQGALPNVNSIGNEYKQAWVAVFRRVKDSGGVPTDAVDMLITGTIRADGAGVSMTSNESRVAAEIAGGNGGVVFETNQPGCNANQACGHGGGWNVLLSDFGLSK